MKTQNLATFYQAFPNERACLDYIFKKNHQSKCSCGGKYYQLKKRRCYACSLCAKQIYPLKGTLFHRSRTPLTKWFFLIFLFSNSRNGVAATEARRILGVTEKTAWRMCKLVRGLMKAEEDRLTGTVEVDETYIGGRRRLSVERTHKNKSIVVGMIKRKGPARVFIVKDRTSATLVPLIKKHVKRGSKLVTDEWKVYTTPGGFGYHHRFVKHGEREYVKKTTHTNSIEGFWGQLKRSLHGTHHYVSKQHLSSYLDEFVFRYNASRLGYDPFSKMMQEI